MRAHGCVAQALPRHGRVSSPKGHAPGGLTSHPIRRRRRRLKRRRSLTYAYVSAAIIIAIVALAAIITLHSTNSVPSEDDPSETESIIDRSVLGRVDTPGIARAVYRHSVIPGGIYSVDEAADATGRDAVAAAHYSDVDLPALRVKQLPAVRRAYVSYRVRDRIYWTRHTVELQAGEAILTDGRNMIRARCGNRISADAREPTADDEPVPAELDAVELVIFEPDQPLAHLPAIPLLPQAAFLSLPRTSLQPRATRQHNPTVDPPDTRTILRQLQMPRKPAIPPLISRGELEQLEATRQRRKPAQQVPESGIWLLVGTGLAGIAIRYLATRRAQRSGTAGDTSPDRSRAVRIATAPSFVAM